MITDKDHAVHRVAPDPREADVFRFTQAAYDPPSGVVRLGYRFDDGPELLEHITFPGAPWPVDPMVQAAFQRALELLHGIAGVSYYKAGMSPLLSLPVRYPDGLADYLTGLYVHGLAEFGYVNALDVAARVRFATDGDTGAAERQVDTLDLPDRALVAMGGGKDSLVALDLLRTAGVDLQPACVGDSSLINDTVRVTGLPLLQIRRQLAPELAAMNRAGAWNGHVPVTAINSAILLCAALLYGYRYIVFANERSADEATLVSADGREVNHQYSKSSAFEGSFRSMINRNICFGIEYFSILRPFSELGVAQRFARLGTFHAVFSSCNRNFHLDGPRVSGRWCRDCPKCRFAALSLALFLSPRELTKIQGGDLLNDPVQEDGFRALCGLGQDKPFECVGEAGESRAAMVALGQRAPWRAHSVVRALQPELARVAVPSMESLLQPSVHHFIPQALCGRLGLAESPRAGY